MNEINTIYNLTAINQKLSADYRKLQEWTVLLGYSVAVFFLAAIVYLDKYL